MTTHLKLHIGDEELADAIIDRLNKLCEDPDVRKDIAALIEERVSCSIATLNHPTIQAQTIDPAQLRVKPGATPPAGIVGFLGVLNGLVGIMPDGPRKGWGYIAADYEDDAGTILVRFQRTKNE